MLAHALYLPPKDGDGTADDWRARKYIWTMKAKRKWKGHTTFAFPDGTSSPRMYYGEDARTTAIAACVAWMAPFVELAPRGTTIVMYPPTAWTEQHAPWRPLQDVLAALADQYAVRWSTQLRFHRPPADRYSTREQLRWVGAPLPPGANVILVDDVVTSGSHLHAGIDFLADTMNCTVLNPCLAVGQTVYSARAPVFKSAVRLLTTPPT